MTAWLITFLWVASPAAGQDATAPAEVAESDAAPDEDDAAAAEADEPDLSEDGMSEDGSDEQPAEVGESESSEPPDQSPASPAPSDTAPAPADAAPTAEPEDAPLPLEATSTHEPRDTDAESSRNRFWLGTILHLSLLGDLIDRSTLLVRAGYGFQGGYRWGDFGVFGLIEEDLWVGTEVDLELKAGVLNVAVGAELIYFDGHLRGTVAIGLAILLSDLPFHDAGRTGLFFEVRPTGLRVAMGGGFTFVFDPLTFAVEAPVLGSPSLVDVEYRIAASVEWES